MKRPEINITRPHANVAEKVGTNRHDTRQTQPRDRDQSGHRWMMIACCIPMLVIAIGLVAAGVVSPGFILVALACTAMMALMMGGASHDGGDNRQ